MENFSETLIAVVSIVCIIVLPILAVAFVLVKLITSNNKERLELARHGIIPPVQSKPSPNKYISLRNGIMCIGIAIGLVLGMYFASINPHLRRPKYVVCRTDGYMQFCNY